MTTSLNDFIAWLDLHTNLERERHINHAIDLKAIQLLCEAAGNPQNAAPCVHVAGSKGKGSVSKMIACILQSAGLKTGLYLSPHVSDFRERVGTAEGCFAEDVYCQAADEVMAAEAEAKRHGADATWFELVTLFAFICFRNAKTQINVIEVGIGGRLDATNVVAPLVTCIMPIEMEHTAWLGDTIEKIAGEKAGIIKEGVPVIAAKQPFETAMQVIERKAHKMNAPCIKAGDINVSYSIPALSPSLDHYRMEASFSCPQYEGAIHACMPLIGEQMAHNAVAAAIAAKTAYGKVTNADVEKGLSVAQLPARFECFNYGISLVIIDGAHTVSSIRSMMSTLAALEEGRQGAAGGGAQDLPSGKSLVFGCASDKDVEDMACLLSKGKWRAVTLTVPGALGRCDLERTVSSFKRCGVAFAVCNDYEKAIRGVLDALDGGALVIAGSFYLAAAARRIVNG